MLIHIKLEGTAIKKNLILFVTIALSILYIFLGNKIASTSLLLYGDENLQSYGAKVLSIDDISEDYYFNDAGERIVTSRNILFTAEITSGELKGEIVEVEQIIDMFVALQPAEINDDSRVIIMENYNLDSATQWVLIENVRTHTMSILAGVFVVCLLIFGGIQGFKTIVSLSFTILSIFYVFIPAILSGKNVYLWTIITAVFIILMTLLVVIGVSRKSLAAMLGCAFGTFTVGSLTIFMQNVLALTGLIEDDSLYLLLLYPDNPTDLNSIIFAGIVIGAIGAIMDVSISIASSLHEVTVTSKTRNPMKIFASGINIGRDIMGTMANTLVLAYIGGSLSVTLLLVAYSSSTYALLNRELIITEILQALIGSFGILLTIPLTSIVCAYLYSQRGGKKRKNDHTYE